MSFIDASLLLSNSQVFSADARCVNVLDLSGAGLLANGSPLAVFIHPTVAADHTTGDETYAFKLQTDDNAGFTSATDLVTWTVPYTALAASSLIELPIPNGLSFEQYLSVYFDGGGTTPTLTADIWVGSAGSLPSTQTFAVNRPVG